MCVGLCSGAKAALSVTAIAAGGQHNLFLAADGTVWASGSNDRGQLGDGTTTNRSAPVPVASLSGVVAFAAGYAHSLAVKGDGTVWAWGQNWQGELGDGTRTNRSTPVRVSGLSGVVAVAGGADHSLALKGDGTVWAWGHDWSGQSGDGTATSQAAPVPVRGLTGAMAIAAGHWHSLAVKIDGTVWSWGNNSYGQLGDGTIAPMTAVPTPSVPVQVSALSGVQAVAAGAFHSLALKRDGTLWAWGQNGAGQVGDGTRDNVRPTPLQVSGLTGVAAIAANQDGNWAVRSDGTVWAWPASGQLTPGQWTGLSGVIAVAGGLALKGDGTVWAWGGAAGNGAPAFRVAPGQIGELTGVAAVASGLALKNDGTVWQWGKRSTPVPVRGLAGVVAIAAGLGYSLALEGDGSVWEWSGQAPPYQIRDLTGVRAIAAGETRGLAVKSDGTVWQWSGRSAPTQVGGLSGVAAVSVAFEWWWDDLVDARTLALKSDGTVWVWAEGTWVQSSTPVQVSGLESIVAIAGGETSLALRADGTVWEWKESAVIRPAPVQVGGLSGVVAVAVGAWGYPSEPYGLALKADGSVWAWGINARGQLGDGTTTSRTSPVQVGGLREVAAVAAVWSQSLAVNSQSLAVKRDGTVWAWGLGDFGQLAKPVQVMQPGSADSAIAMSHAADFTVGDLGIYTLTVSNVGWTATAGPVTVTDTLPPGLTYLFGIGDGWSCSAANEIVTCTNPDPIDPGAASTITLTVRVEPPAWPGVTNLATVTNMSDRNDANNTVGDSAVVVRRQN